MSAPVRWLVAAVVVLLALGWPSMARADAVDDAYVRGNEAAQQGQWEEAAASYEKAAGLLPERNAVLSYNLGTAYAHLGDLGRATYHLQRALDFRGGPTTQVVEAARHNLSVVRRRVEFEATASSAMVDRPQTSWDLVVDALEAPGLAWLALLSGWTFVVALWIYLRVRRSTPKPSTLRRLVITVMLVCGAVFVAAGVLHGWAVRADRTAPEAIVLRNKVEARVGPGSHRKVEFEVQGGAKVRIVDSTPGWRHIRLPGGVAGWVPEDAVARIDAPRHVAGRVASDSKRPSAP